MREDNPVTDVNSFGTDLRRVACGGNFWTVRCIPIFPVPW